jgi:HPt (histidine-containing phosphotransfer) domain-containing protein
MDDYLTKPVRSQEIEEMIEKWKPSGGAETESSVAAEYSGPPEAEAADGIPTAIDLERALTQLGGDRALFDEVLETFLQTIPELLRALHDGCAACDNNAVQAVAHSLKGAASNVCAEPSRAAAQRLEEMTKRGESSGVPALVEEIATHLEGVRTAGAILLNQRAIDSTGEQA